MTAHGAREAACADCCGSRMARGHGGPHGLREGRMASLAASCCMACSERPDDFSPQIFERVLDLSVRIVIPPGGCPSHRTGTGCAGPCLAVGRYDFSYKTTRRTWGCARNHRGTRLDASRIAETLIDIRHAGSLDHQTEQVEYAKAFAQRRKRYDHACSA